MQLMAVVLGAAGLFQQSVFAAPAPSLTTDFMSSNILEARHRHITWPPLECMTMSTHDEHDYRACACNTYGEDSKLCNLGRIVEICGGNTEIMEGSHCICAAWGIENTKCQDQLKVEGKLYFDDPGDGKREGITVAVPTTTYALLAPRSTSIPSYISERGVIEDCRTNVDCVCGLYGYDSSQCRYTTFMQGLCADSIDPLTGIEFRDEPESSCGCWLSDNEDAACQDENSDGARWKMFFECLSKGSDRSTCVSETFKPVAPHGDEEALYWKAIERFNAGLAKHAQEAAYLEALEKFKSGRAKHADSAFASAFALACVLDPASTACDDIETQSPDHDSDAPLIKRDGGNASLLMEREHNIHVPCREEDRRMNPVACVCEEKGPKSDECAAAMSQFPLEVASSQVDLAERDDSIQIPCSEKDRKKNPVACICEENGPMSDECVQAMNNPPREQEFVSMQTDIAERDVKPMVDLAPNRLCSDRDRSKSPITCHCDEIGPASNECVEKIRSNLHEHRRYDKCHSPTECTCNDVGWDTESCKSMIFGTLFSEFSRCLTPTTCTCQTMGAASIQCRWAVIEENRGSSALPPQDASDLNKREDEQVIGNDVSMQLYECPYRSHIDCVCWKEGSNAPACHKWKFAEKTCVKLGGLSAECKTAKKEAKETESI